MEKFMAFMDKYIIPYAAKLGAQRHLVAVRDAFIIMIPVAMMGAFASLVNNLPSDAYQTFMGNVFGEGWRTLGGDIWWGSIAVISLFLVVGVAYNLAKSYKEDGLQAAFIALCIFILAAPQTSVGDAPAWGNINWSYTGNGAMFTAIIVGLLSAECYVKLSKIKFLVIKMPDGVPPAVARSFAKLFPGMITILVFAIASLCIRLGAEAAGMSAIYLNDIITQFVSTPIRNVADSMGGAVFIAFFVHLLWFVGIHGSNVVLGITKPILMDLGAHNMELANAGATEGYHVMAGAFFDAFVYLGGAGVCIGLMLAMVIAGRRRKELIALGLPPACFNINEPVIFGLPICFNPIFFFPFLLAPIVTTIISYASIAAGIVEPVIMTEIPWVTPPILGGLMANGHWTGGALALVNIVISIAIYIPFVIISERMDLKRAEAEGLKK